MAGPDQTFAFYRLFGDLYGSGSVNSADRTAFRHAFNKSPGQTGYTEALDYDGSHLIDFAAYDAFVPGATQTALGTLDLYYDDRGQVIEEQQGGDTTTQYVWSPFYVNQLVERDDQPNGAGTLTRRLYVEQDANFKVTSLTDASGNVVERYVSDPYGTVTVENPDGSVEGDGTLASSNYGMQYLFQGGRIDPATGLYRFGVRDYDPAVGRWEEQDPAGYVDGPSRYQFVESNPAAFVDPAGLGAVVAPTVQPSPVTERPLWEPDPAPQPSPMDLPDWVGPLSGAGWLLGPGAETAGSPDGRYGDDVAWPGAGQPGDPTTQPSNQQQPQSPAPSQPQSPPAPTTGPSPSGQQQSPTTTAGDDGSGAAPGVDDGGAGDDDGGQPGDSDPSQGQQEQGNGSYTNEHASGKTYSGKGDQQRMNQS
jgi:RHS repeat-associated protein